MSGYIMHGSDSYDDGRKVVTHFAADDHSYTLAIQVEASSDALLWWLTGPTGRLRAEGNTPNIIRVEGMTRLGEHETSAIQLALHIMEMVSDGAVGELLTEGVRL